jgi:hypothetical protein
MRVRRFSVAFLVCCLAVRAQTPRFEDYPVRATFTGKHAAPVLATTEQRRYRGRIRNGVATGAGVWAGAGENPIRVKGPNLAGRYFAIRWGCGSQCLMMAIVDAETGKVYEPPLAEKGSLWVPRDNLSEMEIDLRPDSSLMILRDACRDFRDRKTCGTYYFNWSENRFTLVKFVMTKTNP